MKNFITKLILITVVFGGMFFVVSPAAALEDVVILDPLQGFENTSPTTSGDVVENLQKRFADLLGVMFGLLAILSIVPIVLGGQMLVASQGNQGLVKKGKDTLVWGILGLIIGLGGIVLYYAFIGLIIG